MDHCSRQHGALLKGTALTCLHRIVYLLGCSQQTTGHKSGGREAIEETTANQARADAGLEQGEGDMGRSGQNLHVC